MAPRPFNNTARLDPTSPSWIFGFPISEEFTEVSKVDNKPYTVQYFERNRFEYHPEYAGGHGGKPLGQLHARAGHKVA